MQNTMITLAKRPPKAIDAQTFALRTETARLPDDAEIQVKVSHVSIDPAMRGWINDSPSYLPPVGIGETMRAFAIGEITASRHPDFKTGDFVQGLFGVQTIYTGPVTGVSKINPSFDPPERLLGGLGMTGLTAYIGLLHVGQLTEGETVLVSAASGAVGQIVVQIAKLKGARVIGIAGGPEKCEMVTEEFGADGCIDYKSENVAERISTLCPDGIDVYFDNVGGGILEAAIAHMRMRARVVICGAISVYNDPALMVGPRNYLQLLVKSARMEGFVIMHWAHKYAEARADLARWAQTDKLTFREHVETGIENFPQVINMLFSGANKGKLVLKV